MADNTTLNTGSGGDTFRTLEDGSSIKWPVGITAFATTVGSPDVLEIVTPATGLPVRLADGSGYIATLPVSLASVPSHAVTNAGTFAVQAAQSGTWTVTGAGGTFPVTDSGGSLTVDDGGLSLTVDGTVAVSGSVAVTGPLTDAQLRATEVPVVFTDTLNVSIEGASVPVPASQSGVWTVALDAAALAALETITVASVTAPLAAGDNNIGNVDVLTLPALPAGSNTIGSVGTLPLTAGGLSPYSFLSTAAVQAASLKASAGQVYSLQFFNLNAAARYVRIYNQATSPGTGDAANIVWRGMIPGNTAVGGFVVNFPNGLAFGTGIGIRVTAAVADNDNTALAANEVMGSIQYK